ncbi:MAG TPA: hypothetical protein VF011_22075 [Terriglobales bacterium]
MRLVKFMAVLALVTIAAMAMAELNQFGVADIQKVTFSDPMKIGQVVLPKGEYKVQHVMEGENHIMIFTQQKVANPAEARVKCQLVKLDNKAERTQLLYTQDAGNARILQEIVFRGETAKHVF